VAGRRSSSRRDLNISLDPEIPMDRIVLNSRVGSDGTLRISLPPGLAEADHEVREVSSRYQYMHRVAASEPAERGDAHQAAFTG
jgi:hypothetical protein